METYKLYDAEYKRVRLIWEYEPVNSTVLVDLCSDRPGWKKALEERYEDEEINEGNLNEKLSLA